MKKNDGWIPLDDKKKYKWKRFDWKYILVLLAFLTVGYVVKHINYERALKIVKEYTPAFESAISQLSPEETKRFYHLRNKAFNIYRKYLTEEECTDLIAISKKFAKTTATVDEFHKLIAYRNKVFSNATSDEKRLIKEWEQLTLKLSGYKK